MSILVLHDFSKDVTKIENPVILFVFCIHTFAIVLNGTQETKGWKLNVELEFGWIIVLLIYLSVI